MRYRTPPDQRRIDRRAEADLNKKLQTSLSAASISNDAPQPSINCDRGFCGRSGKRSSLRLATDESGPQLSGKRAPPILTANRWLGFAPSWPSNINSSGPNWPTKQKQLEALAVRLEAQHDKLPIRKQALEQWIADRRSEIEGQASRLVAQEMELRVGSVNWRK